MIPRKIKFSLEIPFVGFRFKTFMKLYPKQVVLIKLVFPAFCGPNNNIFILIYY
ncbi:MAG: hypothetical protein ACFFBT_02705 [Promethearchaeota archaeon]